MRLFFYSIFINNLNYETAKFKFSRFNQNVTRVQSRRDDNYLLFIVNNDQLFNNCYIFNKNFYSCLNAKVNQNAFTKMKTMIFCSELIPALFTKVFEATTLFWKVNNEYPNPSMF